MTYPAIGVKKSEATAELSPFTSAAGHSELYVSEDILQGESVPFYVTWQDPRVTQISLEARGFKSIKKLYNVKGRTRPLQRIDVLVSEMKTFGYLGGVLSTVSSAGPSENADLRAILRRADGTIEELIQERTLHSVRASAVNAPRRIILPLRRNTAVFGLEVIGEATALIDIEQPKGGLELTLPKEILTAIERFGLSVFEGFGQLKEEFPKHRELLSEIIEMTKDTKKEALLERIEELDRRMKKLKSDKEFAEAFLYVAVTALVQEGGMKDSVLLPLVEYFEANAAVKVFLESPLLCVKVPKGGGRFKCRLILKDLLGHRCGASIMLETIIESDSETMLPLKEIVKFERKH